jgi:Chlorophyll A-B binding protein
MKSVATLLFLPSLLTVDVGALSSPAPTAPKPAGKKDAGPTKIKSKSIPFAECPATLDGSMAGDVGFDPLCFAMDDGALMNYREAEIKHSRLAMLAAAGWPISELLDSKIASALNLAPLVDDHNRVPSLLNGGLGQISPLYWLLVILAASAIDAYGLTIVNNKDYRPGDLGFDPLSLYKNKGDSWKKWMETAEVKVRMCCLNKPQIPKHTSEGQSILI